MQLENIIQIIIYLHAGLGGIALLAGATALIVKKGGKVHKKSGKVFYYTMLTSALIALIISVLPGHESPFLLSIGIFSIYFLLGGYRSLNFKQKEPNLKLDKLIAYLIILIGILMIAYPLIWEGKMNTVLFVFGIVGLVIGARDIHFFKDLTVLREHWLRLHLGKMTGGYISAVTAFFVVNEFLPGMWDWFAPGIVGTVYIFYWVGKLKGGKVET